MTSEKTDGRKEALALIRAEMEKRGYGEKPRRTHSEKVLPGSTAPWPDPHHFCNRPHCPCNFD